MHLLLIGILLGMGAAIPIGPINLEMIRRNLVYGTGYGIMLGLGACSADITYLLLLCIGSISLLQYPHVLQTFGILGSCILIWFAIGAFRSTQTRTLKRTQTPSLIRYLGEGYVLTLVNPITILFWVSISSQIPVIAQIGSGVEILLVGLGVIIGTVSWVLLLNYVLHLTRHKLNSFCMTLLNYAGGCILLGFAFFGLIKAFHM